MAPHRNEDEYVGFLSGISFFDGFTSDEIRQVVALSTEADFPAGSLIVDQGDPGTVCYVVINGSASVYVRGEFVASSDTGSMIGEMALVDHRPRTATVIADTDLHALRFDSLAFATLLEKMPRASQRVMTVLKSRLSGNNPS